MTKWLEMLGSPSVADRDRATVALIDEGIAVVPELKRLGREASDPIARARAIWVLVGIIRLHQSARLNAASATITLHHRGDRRGLFRLLANHTTVTITGDQPEGDIEIALDDVPLLEALDRIGKLGNLDWEIDRGPSIRFVAGPFAACPVAYAGFFRVRVEEATVERCTDFRTVQAVARLRLSVTMDPSMISLGAPLLRDVRVFFRDSSPLAVEVSAAEDRAGVTRPGVAQYFCRVSLPPSADEISRIEGTISTVFPRSPLTVALEDPTPGQDVEAGNFKIRVEEAGADGCTLRLTDRRGLAPKISGADEDLISRTVLGIDEAGREAVAETKRHTSIARAEGQQRKTSLRVSFEGRGLGRLRSLRLRIVDKVHLSNTPFAVPGFHGP